MMVVLSVRLRVQHLRALLLSHSSVLLWHSPIFVCKFRILHRLCSVLLPPVFRVSGLSRRQRPLPYILGGVLGVLWGDRGDKADTVPPYIKRQLLKAQRALREGDYVGASNAYHSALRRLATSQFAAAQPYIEARAVVLDKLANMYLEQGLLSEAEATFKEVMKFMLKAGMDQESDAMVEISLNLSKIYTNQSNHELADAGFSWCVATAEKLCSASRTENNLALWGLCLQSKGQYHLSRGQWDSAVSCLREALHISVEVFSDSHTQVGVLHNDLATALDGGDLYSDAESHARSSLRILSRSHSTLEYLTRVHYNLGMILSHQGKDSEARDELMAALEMAKRAKDRQLQRHIEHLLNQMNTK